MLTFANDFLKKNVVDFLFCQRFSQKNRCGCQYLPTVLRRKPLLIHLILPTVISKTVMGISDSSINNGCITVSE
jgi:hypothetical protein